MRLWLLLAGVSGASAVIAGALAAHAADQAAADRLATAVRYQMWHALALLAVAWLASSGGGRVAAIAGWAFVAGTVLFCGSLYLSVLTGTDAATSAAPAGGAAFILGWLALALEGLRRPRRG